MLFLVSSLYLIFELLIKKIFLQDKKNKNKLSIKILIIFTC